MKKWEIALLLLLVAALALSAVTGTLATAQKDCPEEKIYCWWGVLYPFAEDEEQPKTYEVKFYSAELWQKLCAWWDSIK